MREADERGRRDTAGREALGHRGDAVYDQLVRPNVAPADEGKFVAIDVDTGDYEVDQDELTAVDGLQSRRPNASVWLTRVGSRYAYRLGSTCNETPRAAVPPERGQRTCRGPAFSG